MEDALRAIGMLATLMTTSTVGTKTCTSMTHPTSKITTRTMEMGA